MLTFHQMRSFPDVRRYIRAILYECSNLIVVGRNTALSAHKWSLLIKLTYFSSLFRYVAIKKKTDKLVYFRVDRIKSAPSDTMEVVVLLEWTVAISFPDHFNRLNRYMYIENIWKRKPAKLELLYRIHAHDLIGFPRTNCRPYMLCL